MDPITLLVRVLTKAVSKLAEPLVHDAYTALKKIIQEKTGNRADVQMTLTKHEKSPADWRDSLKATLKETNAASDPDIAAALKRLETALAQASQTASASHEGDVITATHVHKGNNLSDNSRFIQMGDHSEYHEGKKD